FFFAILCFTAFVNGSVIAGRDNGNVIAGRRVRCNTGAGSGFICQKRTGGPTFCCPKKNDCLNGVNECDPLPP
ncbi:9058_t:CDS:2, partial [Diversispora eburnea]